VERKPTQDEFWAIVERYILDTLLETGGDNPITLEAAVKAAVDFETTIDSGHWNTRNVTRVHSARIRLIKLILGLRETHRDDPLTDTVSLKRWAGIATIIEYHNEHWVAARREDSETRLVSLALPDGGTKTMYELGNRVWLNKR